jgi:YidC/Oxa1 family membrane protein insertase
LPALGLKLIKRYSLAKVASEEGPQQPAYHLNFEIEIQNIGSQPQDVAYRLDGPTGLVLEGAWYASKISRNWGSAGLRDVDGKFKAQGTFRSNEPDEVGCPKIASGEAKAWPTAPLEYVAVDAQYFAAALIPAERFAEDFMEVKPIRVGAVPKDSAEKRLTDVSFRIISRAGQLKPGGDPIKHEFKLFLGPKVPELLANYGTADAPLSALVYYGWPVFALVAKQLLWVLHGFYGLVHNYGVAIVMLTVLVRGCMFPLSRKQAVSAQKMQELQPQIKQISEKYKKEPEKLRKAQQELFQKHNYNPLGGCWMMFIQLPIFMGLYRSLMVDVELRQAPLISDGIRWCSNLAAPDMLYDWSAFMPEFVTKGTGMLGLGPYLNLFPLVTIGLFIWQQKMFMPPPADEQAAMQQKMMQYMMVFMGIMFFKVASGLCLYFIASSIWGITERKLLHPPQTPAGAAGAPAVGARPEPGGNGHGGGGKRKERGRR